MLLLIIIGLGISELWPRQNDTTLSKSPLTGTNRNTPLDVEDVHWKRSPLHSKDHAGIFAGVTSIVLIKEIPEFLH